MTILRPPKVMKSVFVKLLIVILLTGLCINVIVLGFFRHVFHGSNEPYRRNLANYIHYMIDDIGEPPDPQRAREISEKNLLHIGYKSPTLSFATSEKIDQLPLHRWRLIHETADTQILFQRGRFLVKVHSADGTFTFLVERDFKATYFQIAELLLLLSLILLAAYIYLRRTLQPIRRLSTAVDHVIRGDLDHRVPMGPADELGRLAEAFNRMTQRLQSMLAARDQLLLDVSHELRTPLTRLKVAREFLPDGRAKQSIGDDVVEMETLITAILEEARIRKRGNRIDRRSADLAALLAETVTTMAAGSSAIRTDITPASAPAEVDPELIRIVFRNIIQNALKHSGNEPAPVSVCLRQEDRGTVITVKNRGAGIPPEEIQRVFEPFYRVDKSRSRRSGGYGIGLSLCKTIMDAHDAEISLASHPGGETVVQLVFPGKKGSPAANPAR